MKPSITLHHLVLRQVSSMPQFRGGVSCFTGTSSQLLDIVEKHFEHAEPGYREGVILIPIRDPDLLRKFFSATHLLKEGEVLSGKYVTRSSGEKPRIKISAQHRLMPPAQFVQIVLYHRNVLLEGKEECTDSDWHVLSLNVSPTPDPEPMPLMTLLYNHFHEPGSNDGGTTTHWSNEVFIDKLRESFMYWRDRVLISSP